MSTTSGYGVVDVSSGAMFSNLKYTYVSDNLRLKSSASYGGINYDI